MSGAKERRKQTSLNLEEAAPVILRNQIRAGWYGGAMNNMKSWMLGAAIVTGAVGMGATPAHAAQFGIYVGGPAAYVPPCPGPGYAWVNGYMANGYWVPGQWQFMRSDDRGWDREDGWGREYGWRRDNGWRRDDGWRRERDWNRGGGYGREGYRGGDGDDD